MIFILLCYLRLVRRWKCESGARVITIQHEQYDVTVHLFIGMGRSPDKITFMPLTSTLNHNANYQGLSSLFPLRSVSSFIFAIIQDEAPLAIASVSIHVAFGLYPHITHLHPKAEASCNSLCYTENMWLVTFFRTFGRGRHQQRCYDQF